MANIDSNFKGTALVGNELILGGEHFTAEDLQSGNGISILNYHKVISYSNTSSPVIPDYVAGSRIYQIYRDGVYLSPNRDYTISSSGVVEVTTSSGNANYDIIVWSASTDLPITPEDQTLGLGIWLNSSNEVVITTSSNEATIYYTTDGSIPNSGSNVYSEPFSPPATSQTVVTAIAILGDKSSAIRSLLYNPTLAVGQIVTFEDGISGTIIYDAGSEQSWGRYLVVDNNGLGYYINGESDLSPDVQTFIFGAWSYGVPDSNYYFASESLLYDEDGYPSSTAIGDGLNLTNKICADQSYTGWPWHFAEGTVSLFESIKEIRKQRGNSEWFLPVSAELDYLYNNRTSVPNLNTSSGLSSYYFSSKESSATFAYVKQIYDNTDNMIEKAATSGKARLMRFLSTATNKCAAPSIFRNTENQQVEMSCVDGAQIYYTLDGSDPISNGEVVGTLYSAPIKPNNSCEIRAQAIGNNYSESNIAYINYKVYDIGDVVMKDGIATVCVYAGDKAEDWGQYIFVDRDHDLSYYINQTTNGGVQWGPSDDLGLTDTIYRKIGQGKSNSDLFLNNIPTSNIIGSWLRIFRSSHSNDWFIPSLQELSCVYNNSGLLNNLTNNYYWSSSEYDSYRAWNVTFYSGNYSDLAKSSTYCVRACWAL